MVTDLPVWPTPAPTHWLTYHLAHPGPGEAMPGDPNCAFFWNDRYHLHYIYRNAEGFAFAHVSSPDMVHWTWHPTTLTPSHTGHGMYSGTGFLTKEGRPAIIYHGEGSNRNQLSVAEDDQLEQWAKPWKLEPTIRPDQDGSTIANWDPDAWIDGDHYYALSGGSPGSGKPPTLFRSSDLKSWDFVGLFLGHDMPGVLPDEDISCPNFFTIGNKHMLLCISHTLGCRYYLGEWHNEVFTPDFHARMNWNKWDCFAPESVLTPDGRRVMWAWCNLDGIQSGIQTLPRELSLPEDGVLRIKPLRELAGLRRDPQRLTGLRVAASHPVVLPGFTGAAIEISLVITPRMATACGLRVFADAAGLGGTAITVDRSLGTLCVGGTSAPFVLAPHEDLALRVFLDRGMIEVFANDRQAVVVAAVAAQSHVSMFSAGDEVLVQEAQCWRIASIHAPEAAVAPTR